MFKRFCGRAFGTINVAVGFSSLAAIVVGAITVFGSAGLLCLDKAGVKTLPEKRIQQTLQREQRDLVRWGKKGAIAKNYT
jgi:hypothetical protein